MRKSIFLVCVLISGCATYSETGILSNLDDAYLGSFGFSRSGVTDTPLAANAYRIRGYGNQNASFNKTNALAFMRAASLAHEHGYDRFQIFDFSTWEKSTLHHRPATSYTTAQAGVAVSGNVAYAAARSDTYYRGAQAYTRERPRTDIVVKFIRAGTKGAEDALLVSQIAKRYGKKSGLSKEELALMIGSNSPTETVTEFNQSITKDKLVVPIQRVKRDTVKHEAYRTESPTLDQVYKSLSRSKKNRINKLSPTQRADALQKIRNEKY